MSDMAELHTQSRDSITPAMLEVLARQLNVSYESLEKLEIGWSFKHSAWVFPERDAEGAVIGLVCRYANGTKRCVKGSNRGLTFAPIIITDGYDASRQKWRRVTEDSPCPICDKPDWCGVDALGETPRFVRCMRVAENAAHTCAAGGYIHELIPGAFKSPTKNGVQLEQSDRPILIVEGASDVAAAMDAGFVAVGKPSAEGGNQFLRQLLAGYSVIVLGENDAGAGRAGMNKTFEALKSLCPGVKKVLPPVGVKDFRAWKKSGVSEDDILAHLNMGETESEPNLLEDIAPLYIAERWLRDTYWRGEIPTLRLWNGMFYLYDGQCYRDIDENTAVRGKLYDYLEDKVFRKFSSKGEVNLEPYRTTRSKVNDLVDALNRTCPVEANPPCWLTEITQPKPTDTLVLTNGILDVEAFLTGADSVLLPLTPDLFCLTATPYAFDPNARCPRWKKFVSEVFDGDTERTLLLQEWFGYNIVADTSMQKMMLFVGRPGSGKSTTIDVLEAVLGSDQCTSLRFRQLCDKFGLMNILGKRAALMPDAHIPQRADAIQALDTLKHIVGQDTISVEPKYKAPIDIQPTARITMAANELPYLPDHARALERRLLILQFPISFQGREDRTLRHKLPAEAPGILLWSLEGLRRLRQQGAFTVPSSSTEVVEEFRKIISPIAEFVEDCCIVGEGREVQKVKLYNCWQRWAKQRNVSAGSKARFSQKLRAQVTSITEDRRREGNDRPYFFLGIMLTDEAKKEFLLDKG